MANNEFNIDDYLPKATTQDNSLQPKPQSTAFNIDDYLGVQGNDVTGLGEKQAIDFAAQLANFPSASPVQQYMAFEQYGNQYKDHLTQKGYSGDQIAQMMAEFSTKADPRNQTSEYEYYIGDRGKEVMVGTGNLSGDALAAVPESTPVIGSLADKAEKYVKDTTNAWKNAKSARSQIQTYLGNKAEIEARANGASEISALMANLGENPMQIVSLITEQAPQLLLGGMGKAALTGVNVAGGAGRVRSDIEEAYETTAKENPSQLLQLPEIKDRMANGMSFEEAVNDAKTDITDNWNSIVAGAVIGGTEVFTPLGKFGQGVNRGVLKTLGKEVGQEAFQEGAEQLNSNLAVGSIDGKTQAFDNVIRNSTLGGIAGLGTGIPTAIEAGLNKNTPIQTQAQTSLNDDEQTIQQENIQPEQPNTETAQPEQTVENLQQNANSSLDESALSQALAGVDEESHAEFQQRLERDLANGKAESRKSGKYGNFVQNYLNAKDGKTASDVVKPETQHINPRFVNESINPEMERVVELNERMQKWIKGGKVGRIDDLITSSVTFENEEAKRDFALDMAYQEITAIAQNHHIDPNDGLAMHKWVSDYLANRKQGDDDAKSKRSKQYGKYTPFLTGKANSVEDEVHTQPSVEVDNEADVANLEPNVETENSQQQTLQNGVRYSLNESNDSDFIRSIEDISSGKRKGRDDRYLNMGTTPDVFKMIGLPDTKVSMRESVIDKVTQGKHKIDIDDFKQLPNQINNPIAVTKSRTRPNGYVVLTELNENVDGVKKPVIAALHLNKTNNGLEVVNIVSSYGRNISQLNEDIKESLYWNKTKGYPFARTVGLQLPSSLASVDNLSAKNIKTETDLSQYQSGKNTATPSQNTQDQATLSRILGEKTASHIQVVDSNTQIPTGKNVKKLAANGVDGWFDVSAQKLYIISDNITANEVLNRDERLAWVAFHELSHAGVRIQFGSILTNVLASAGKNVVVKVLARKIQAEYGYTQEVATEEAMAEIYAAFETGNWVELESRYKVKIHQSYKQGKDSVGDFLTKVANILRRLIGGIVGKDLTQTMTTSQVFDTLRGIQQGVNDIANSEQNQTASDDMRYSFAGEKANTADHSLLEKAKADIANGKDSETVRQETGWFTGKDGKWRFEIDDSNISFKQNFDETDNALSVLIKSGKSELPVATVGDILNAPELFSAYPELEKINVVNSNSDFSAGGYLSSNDSISLNSNLPANKIKSTLLHELQHAIQKREQFAYGGSTDPRFISALQQELYENVEDSHLTLQQLNDKHSVYTSFINKGKEAELKRKEFVIYRSVAKLRDYAYAENITRYRKHILDNANLVHGLLLDIKHGKLSVTNEVRKALSSIDGNTWNLPHQRSDDYPHALRVFALDTAEAFEKVIRDESITEFNNDKRTFNAISRALDKAYNAVYADAENARNTIRNAERKVRQAESLESKYGHHNASPYQIYTSMAGEVESRNVETRMDMTVEERRHRSPESTEDVKRENQIVRYADGSIANIRYSRKQSAMETANAKQVNQHPNALDRVKRGGFAQFKKEVEKARAFIDTKVHDRLRPVMDWIDGIEVQGLSAYEKSQLKDSIYAAEGIKSDIIVQAELKYLNPIRDDIAAMAKKYFNGDGETALKKAGFWISTRWAIEKNAQMLKADYDAMIDAEQEYNDSVANGESMNVQDRLERAFIKAENQYYNRKADVESRDFSDDRKYKAGTAGGWSTPLAKAIMAKMESQIPRAELEALAERVYDLNEWKLDQDLESGRFTAEEVERFKQDRHYVPLTGNPSMELDDMLRMPSNRNPNVAKDKGMEGRKLSEADDAITTIWESVAKTATYNGWQPMKAHFAKLYDQAYQEAISNGLSQEAATDEATEKTGIAKQKMQGLTRTSDNVLIYKENGNYYELSLPKKAMEQIKKQNSDNTPAPLRPVQAATGWFARSVTQFKLHFAAVNMVRDLWEKSEFVRTKEIFDKNGNPLPEEVKNQIGREIWKQSMGVIARQNTDVWKAAKRYAMKQELRDDVPAESELKTLLKNGGVSTHSTLLERKETDLISTINKRNSSLAKGIEKAIRAVEIYNGIFDIVSSISANRALLKYGVDPKHASAVTLDLTNLRKQGDWMPFIKSFYMFAQPAAIGGANLIKMMGTKTGRTRLLKGALFFGALSFILRSIADEDEDGNAFAKEGDKDRFIPIPIGEYNFKLPVGYGAPQLMWNMGYNITEAIMGDKTWGDAAASTMLHAFKSVAPVSPSEVPVSEYPGTKLLMTLTPTIAQPIVQNIVNRNAFGSQLASSYINDKSLKAEQGEENAAPFWTEAALWLNDTFGMDFAPEHVKNFVQGYANMVPLMNETLTILVENPNKARLGKPESVPFINALVGPKNPYATQSQFYRFRDEANDTVLNFNSRKERGTLPESWITDPEIRWQRNWFAKVEEMEKTQRKVKSNLTKLHNEGKLSTEVYQHRLNNLAKDTEAKQRKLVGMWRSHNGLNTTATRD